MSFSGDRQFTSAGWANLFLQRRSRSRNNSSAGGVVLVCSGWVRFSQVGWNVFVKRGEYAGRAARFAVQSELHNKIQGGAHAVPPRSPNTNPIPSLA